MGAAVVEQARYHASVHACCEVETPRREAQNRGNYQMEEGVPAGADYTRRSMCVLNLKIVSAYAPQYAGEDRS